jgi:hypothetical protein
MGGDLRTGRRRRVRRARRVADPGALTDRRRVDPHARRAAVPRRPRVSGAGAAPPERDAYFLLQGRDRELLVPDPRRRSQLWTPRVWPGALLVEGEIVGTWRRAQEKVSVQTWRRLSRAARDAVEAEAESLPLPGVQERVVVRWD